MGRYNFTALRVRRRALQALESDQTSTRPSWLEITGNIPPAQIFVKKQPQQHLLEKKRTVTTKRIRGEQVTIPPQMQVTYAPPRLGKKSRMLAPMKIRFEEDQLRQRFYKDHPWELARPRIVLESDGHDASRLDWSRGIEQHQNGKKLDGESVIQRQLYILQNTPNITRDEAYDIARREFYHARQQEDVERRVAIEEARYTGAQFGPDPIRYGMQMEDAAYDEWEKWSRRDVLEKEQRRAAFTGENASAPNELADLETENTKDADDEGAVQKKEEVKIPL